MAFRKITSNLEILHGSMKCFCTNCPYTDRGGSGIFGGIFPALETGFPLVGREKGFRGSIKIGRASCRERVFRAV